MNHDNSIDIVVPSYRLVEDILLRIINLNKPNGFDIYVYIVADNPSIIVSENLKNLHRQKKIVLIINETNLGFSASRNKGIRAGKSKWILLLDDDVYPEKNLLQAYASAIKKHENAIGFVGLTQFPKPFNKATKALQLSGITSHFESSLHVPSMVWAPTANILLNRNKLDERLFDENLKTGGEDIDLLSRNSFFYGEKYLSLPSAIVKHPWWNNGRIQTKRLVRYGIAASKIMRKELVAKYTYRDFTNTSETILLLLLLLPFAIIFHKTNIVFYGLIAVILAELMTNYIKTIIQGKTYSPFIALHLAWIKNCREFGQLYGTLMQVNFNDVAKRIELGFAKPHPSPFRLNRWKIIKLFLILIFVVLLVAVQAMF